MATPRQRSGLGRGLGDLIRPTSAEPAPESNQPRQQEEPESGSLVPAPAGAAFVELPVDEIAANPRQPRHVFDEDDLSELVESIREVGLLQPVVVRRVEDGYELVMGERRLRATRKAGLTHIPAIVRETADHDLLRDALLENLHRVQLNPLEEAAAYQQMLDDFGCTQEELATRIKRSRPQISNTIRLLRLPAPVQRRVAAGVLSAGHARALLMVQDPVEQERLAQRIVAEGLSVRSVEELVAVGERAPRTRRTIARTPSPRAAHLAEVFSDSLDTRVNVQIGKSKGKITIEFAGEDDLDRILTVLRDGVSTQG
ncbi:MAG: ParB/RepB/Spo0J family partition protein [Propionibacteriaceae bacterium]|nr:ParB/RepB/Spo0J family partition protein [Propionibacteriaceae bacterium]